MERRSSSPKTKTTGLSATRSESLRTDESNFADSAVDMDAGSNPPLTGSSLTGEISHQIHSLSPISQSLADRLRRLAAAAWALEQDDDLTDLKKQYIKRNLRNLEAVVEDDEVASDDERLGSGTGLDNAHQHGILSQKDRPQDEEETCDKDSDIIRIHDDIAAVVASMRQRQQEQQHLHQLTATKLEALAQRCLFQEKQMQDLVDEVKGLRAENQILGRENDSLRDTIAELESETYKREVAVSAMTSAVAGLEGWIDDAEKSRLEQDTMAPPVRGDSRQRRAVVRGKGRFRGRYYVDEQHSGSPDINSIALDLQDDVKAWIRGFRDVADACNTDTEGRARKLTRRAVDIEYDDWGEFESPASSAF